MLACVIAVVFLVGTIIAAYSANDQSSKNATTDVIATLGAAAVSFVNLVMLLVFNILPTGTIYCAQCM